MKRQASGYINVNGGQLYYETAGAGDILVLIHGFGLDTRMWDDQFGVFADRYFVVRYDMRGFGKSSLPGRERYAHYDDLKMLLDELGVSKAHILGLSAGGRVAMEFAITYAGYVLSLILADSGLNGYMNKQVLFEDIMAAAPSVGAIAANRMWLDHVLFAPAREQEPVAARLAAMVGDYSGWHWVNENPLQILEPAAIEQLNKIRAKTLVIVGERDLQDYKDMADIFVQTIPGAVKKMIPGVGHMSNMENPGLFNQLMLEFLNDSNS